MSCETCHQMRMDWLNAMIALDVAKVASITTQAVAHMVGADDGAEIRGGGVGVDAADGAPDADGVQTGG